MKILKNKYLWIIAGLLVVAIWLFIPISKPIIGKDYSQVIKASNGKILRAYLNENEQWCFPVNDTLRVPEKLMHAVVLYEDEYFYKHPGVNPVSLFRALIQNTRQKQIVSGASTLTMQVARMHFNKKRTYFHKTIEMLYALKLELHYSKNELLKTYVDHAPYGRNIIGYQAASIKYFQKLPNELSWSESATLAVLPNAPGLISPGKNDAQLIQKRNTLLEKLYHKGKIDEVTLKSSLNEPVPNRVYAISIVAPHLSNKIRQDLPHRDEIETSIDYDLQRYLNFVCKNYQHQLSQQGIHNLSVLVVDNETGLVKSYIGSSNFYDKLHNGEVDGVQAKRSSGSILKPFLYALSLDEGLISPHTLIKDIPTFYEGFSPNNADHKFRGIVNAQQALISSLNVPAVRLLYSYGVYSFYHFLKEAGVSTLFREPEEYGLPIILGGAEVTPWDIAALYRGLSQKGNFSRISFLKADSKNSSKSNNQMISPGAALLTLNALKELNRPGEEQFWRQYVDKRNMAWKTGTSYGHKDAWACGVTPDHTVVVWCGNFTGEGNVELGGAVTAGPLMLEVLGYVDGDKGRWFTETPKDFKQVRICEDSGFLAGSNCNHTHLQSLPRNAKPLKTCPFHQRYEVDNLEDKTVCSLCWEDGHHSKNYLIFPPEVVFQLHKNGQYPETVPSHKAGCLNQNLINQLEFIYPKDSTKIWLPMDFNEQKQKVIFKLASTRPQNLIYWYLDDKYLGTTQNEHTKVLSIEEGWHRMSVNGQNGSKSSVVFQIATTQ